MTSVGIITSHMSFDEHGGANYSRHRVAQELCNRGYDVTVYTLNFRDENSIPVAYDYDLVETRIDSYTVYDGVLRFFGHMDTYFERNDLIHVYVPGVIPLVGLYKQLRGKDTPLVGTLNGYTPFCTNTAIMKDGCWQDCGLTEKITHSRMEPAGDFTYGSLARFVFNNYATVPLMNTYDRFLCLSPAVADIYADIGINSDVLTVVPNMTDPHFKTHDPVATEETRILYVGRVDAMKSISNLLHGIAQTDTESYHVDIVGDNILDYGKPLDGYRQEAKTLGIADRVTFHGWVDYTELSQYYAKGDIFVHPAEWPEPFGRTIIEAMQHELPVICSDVGAPPWITGSAGLSYAKEDTESLAQCLDTLVTNDAQRTQMKANTTVELERFKPDVVMPQLQTIYSEVSE
jgi:glycosyltransferase involved in cell wall biosynthesis